MGEMTCPECYGSGSMELTEYETDENGEETTIITDVPCYDCNGRGMVEEW